ncbi:MAG: hypothetical protein CTY20_00635 [Hyphomicrobium sp.]|nr:MAG: hypothetical protein CTY20_00635 [Hyphomicrobium sp.]
MTDISDIPSMTLPEAPAGERVTPAFLAALDMTLADIKAYGIEARDSGYSIHAVAACGADELNRLVADFLPVDDEAGGAA